MNINRRKFLTSTGAVTASTLVGNLGSWGIESANAQGGPAYRAMVCVFLFGGNDSNNMIVPYTDYAEYAAVRTPASNVALTQAQLIQFSAPSNGKTYGFHPSMSSVAPHYTSGKMAVIANAGTLIRPMTRDQYRTGGAAYRPPNLFSHSDQQDAHNGLVIGQPVRTGWGGRYADRLVAANAGALIPSAVSVSGSQLYTAGATTAPLVVPQNGGVTVSGQAADAVSTARYNALLSLIAAAKASGNQVVVGGAGVMDKALTANNTANPILTAGLPAVIDTAFRVNGNLLNTGIAQQLRQVARLIEGRAATGVKRQVFFVSMGGYDTHTNTITNQTNLFNQLFPAMNAFYNYTVAAGIANDVVQFTLSDFNRTFIGNAGNGVDHAYGGHQVVLGGSVRGGQMYGTFPQLVRSGPDDAGSNGSWIPSTSVDQVASTLGGWFGMPQSDIDQVFPNLANFTTKNLGFMA
ncbi:MAG: DUF1501 domain-containing protein [Betaproteobacteria bacterium]|nr:DUF1501 domain-containing protein [Betaproteobacteria bacterium]